MVRRMVGQKHEASVETAFHNLENRGNIHQFEAISCYKRLIAWGMGERKLSWLSRLCQDRTQRFQYWPKTENIID